MNDYEDLAAWAESLPDSFADAGLDPSDPLDAKILDFVGRAGGEVSALARDYERLKEENETLAKRVKRLENKLFAIINMAKDVSLYAERAIKTGAHGEPTAEPSQEDSSGFVTE